MNTKKSPDENVLSKHAPIPTLDDPLMIPEDDLDLDSLDIPILTDVIADADPDVAPETTSKVTTDTNENSDPQDKTEN